MNTVEKGKKGEDIVCNYMKQKGFVILERNWRCGHLEIDIIAHRPSVDNFLHIVEVRTRTEPIALEPASTVNDQKQRHVIAAARGYLRMKMLKNVEVVFDVAAVSFFGERAELQYISNAYQPKW